LSARWLYAILLEIIRETHMSKPLTSADLPDDVAPLAEAEIAAGHFASVDDLVRAGVYAIIQRDAERLPDVEDEAAFIAAVQDGLTASARGEGRPHAEVMARADARIAEHERRRSQ
jgi:Arc/MetJ-type ribon-helix-helix transcriptional regulator